MSLKNLTLDVRSIALALSEERGYEYYHIDDELKELAKNVSDMQAENVKLRKYAKLMHDHINECCNACGERCICDIDALTCELGV